MRIAIDARKLHDFGIGTYIRNILQGLARLDHENEYIVFCRREDVAAASGLGPNFRAVMETARPYSVSEQIHIPIRLSRERVHLFHEPHYVLPVLTRCRSVVTIHDCIHLMFPQYLPGSLAHFYARGAMWTAVRKSDRILTVSEASKRDILRFFDVAPEKVVVIYNAIDERFLAPPDDERMDLIRQRYQLADAGVGDAVDDRAVVAAGLDEPAPAQAAEVGRNGGLRQPNAPHDLPRRELAALLQQPQDAQPGRISQAAEVLPEQLDSAGRFDQGEGRAGDDFAGGLRVRLHFD